MNYLIVNADDFGLTAGVTYGIWEGLTEGWITSTTMMVNQPASSLAANLLRAYGYAVSPSSGAVASQSVEAVASPSSGAVASQSSEAVTTPSGGAVAFDSAVTSPSAAKTAEFSVGLHINLSLGQPLTDCPTLTRQGHFIKPQDLEDPTVYDPEEIAREIDAQYRRFVALTGCEPSHLDTHLYAHQKFENVRREVIALAERLSVPVRGCRTTKYIAPHFEAGFKVRNGDTLTTLRERLEQIVRDMCAADRDVELMVHPAFLDNDLLEISSYRGERVMEATVIREYLMSDSLPDDIQLIDYTGWSRKNIRSLSSAEGAGVPAVVFKGGFHG